MFRSWWMPVGVVLLFGFVFYQHAEGRRDCETRCAARGYEAGVYDAGSHKWARPETCECCERIDGRIRNCEGLRGFAATR